MTGVSFVMWTGIAQPTDFENRGRRNLPDHAAATRSVGEARA